MKKEQKLSVTAIIFYVFAVLFLAYSAFMIFTAYEYVAGYVEQGTISYGKDFKDILSVYVQQAGPYLVYALLLYGIGYIIDVVTKIKGSMNMEVKEVLSTDKKEYNTAKLDNKEHEKVIAAKEAAVNTVKSETKKASKKDDVKKEEPKKEEKAEAKKENTKADAKKETKPKSTKTKAKKADVEKTDKTKPQEKKEESAEAVETK